MKFLPKHLMQKTNVAFLSALLLISNTANAGDPSTVVGAVADAPPEAQVKILRILFEDVAGSPQELKQRLVTACKNRVPQKCIKTSTLPCPQDTVRQPTTPAHSLKQKSKAALLSRLCLSVKP
jgi:hypothetical protein